ncbi:MAG: oxidoreductase [Hyphomonadaceae bacterium]
MAGKTWFITGANRGLGLEMARAALAAGENVVAAARDGGAMAKALPGDRVLAVSCDVSNDAQVAKAVEAALERFGRIDVLVNNAGYGQMGMFEELTPEDYARQYETNFFGLMRVTRAVLPVMRRQRSGHVFNLSSVAGVITFPAASAYCSSKFAVEGFSEALAQEVAPFNIHVTIVAPGGFRTDFLDASSIRYAAPSVPDYAEEMSKKIAGHKKGNHQQPGDPAKLGAALVRLANEKQPPLRFAAGTDAVAAVERKIAQLQTELDQWRALSSSLAFDS